MQFGHALAAAAEGVHVTAAGVSLVLLAPAAFVELDDADLAALSRRSMLRVACAGAWHNMAAGLACYAAQAVLLPLLGAGGAGGWAAPLHLLLAYSTSLSAALALLNLAPVHYLDGEQVLQALLLRPRKGSRPLPQHQHADEPGGSADAGSEQAAAPAASGARRAAVVRWALHAGSGAYAAVLVLHLLRLR